MNMNPTSVLTFLHGSKYEQGSNSLSQHSLLYLARLCFGWFSLQLLTSIFWSVLLECEYVYGADFDPNWIQSRSRRWHFWQSWSSAHWHVADNWTQQNILTTLQFLGQTMWQWEILCWECSRVYSVKTNKSSWRLAKSAINTLMLNL